jgi:hypothetical protein
MEREVISITTSKYMNSHIDSFTFFFKFTKISSAVAEIEVDEKEMFTAYRCDEDDTGENVWIEVVNPQVFVNSKNIPDELNIQVIYKKQKLTLQQLCKIIITTNQ